MKKYIVLLILLIACQAGYSQTTVDQLFEEFSSIKQAEGVKLGKAAMTFAGIFTDTMGVSGIEAYSFDACSEELKDKLHKAIKELKDSKYETMVTSNEEGNRTRVLVRMEDDIIREMVVITVGNSNALVRIKGKIKPSDIERVTKKHG